MGKNRTKRKIPFVAARSALACALVCGCGIALRCVAAGVAAGVAEGAADGVDEKAGGPQAVLWIRAGRLAGEEMDPAPEQTPSLLALTANGFTAADLRLGDIAAADRGDVSALSAVFFGEEARARLGAVRKAAFAEVGNSVAADEDGAPSSATDPEGGRQRSPESESENGPAAHGALAPLIRRFGEPPPEGPMEREFLDRIRTALLGPEPRGKAAKNAKPAPLRRAAAASQPDPAAETTAGEALKALKGGAALVIAREPVGGPAGARARDLSLGRLAVDLRRQGVALLVLSVQAGGEGAREPPRATLVMVGPGVRAGWILGAERPAQAVAPTVLDLCGVPVGAAPLPWREIGTDIPPGAAGDNVPEGAADAFEGRIQSAIDRGRAHLLQAAPRLFSRIEADFPMGRIALPLSALLRAGLASDHEVVDQALSQLDGMPPAEVYSVACYLMALDALAKARQRESRDGRIERAAGPRTRARAGSLDPALRRRMEELVQWLLKARNRGQGTWHYRGPGGHDYSNTQFAVLGLEIGLEHGISVPREVFGEVAAHFAASQLREKEPYEFTVQYNPGKKLFLQKGAVEAKTLRVPVGGWGYTDRDRRAYASMTAAGASSLLVARRALGGSLSRSAESAIESALGWIVHRFQDYLKGSSSVTNDIFYELYSLEKVGDLGDIVLLGLHDWYREGARLLVEGQARDGSWGKVVDTSFALLFLTRATRPSLRASPPPRIATGGGPGSAQTGDRVYVGAIDGYISASEFLQYLLVEGDQDLLKVADEVVRNYPLARQGELVTYLVPLAWGKGGPVEAFARRALGEVTGEKGRKPEFYDEWRRAFEAIRALEVDARAGGEKAAELLASAPGRLLRARLVELAGRDLLVECVPPLIEEMRSSDAAQRRRVGEVLQRLTGERIAGTDGSPEDAARAAESYRAFWQGRSERLLAAARIRRLVAELERSSRAQERAARQDPAGPDLLVDGLVGEGRAALPQLIEALERPEFPARLLAALERIAGVRLGLRPALWRAWWNAQPR